MKRPVVVVPGLVRKDVVAYLAEHVEVRQWTEKEQMPRELLKEWLVDADGLWSIGNITVDKDLIEGAKQLKVIAQASVGYDNVNIADLTERKIPYGNTPDVLTETVAELAFTLIASASRRIYENMNFVVSGKWMERPSNIKGFDLSKRTLGIIGMGKIGVSVARRARSFGMTVQYYNRRPRLDDKLHRATYVALGELLSSSDVILVMAPLTEETKHMINKEAFDLMKPSALFVNVGRGKIVDTDALVDALNEGKISYAALDVVDPEPLPGDHPLLQTGKVLIVPHIGPFTDRTRKEMTMLTANNLINGVYGKPLLACVNSEVNYTEDTEA